MSDERGKPSSWLLKNSKGFPDFLFTILTYSMLLLVFVTLCWVAFAVLTFLRADTGGAVTILQIMDSMKTGLISLAGVIFGLAGSYTVRRFKTDDHYIEKKKLDSELEAKEEGFSIKELVQKGLKLVHNEEDI
jgi:H+/Cl- antiporter ClcA